jgi:DNA-binding response OmpR family regulator
MMRVLLVEDDALLGSGLRSALGKSGFDVTWVRDGEAALDVLDSQTFIALVLDIGLPKISGTEVVRRLRAQGCPVPILILTAGDSMLEKVTNLECGADDFLAKTVEMEELVARLRALVRRSGQGTVRCKSALCDWI